MARGAIPEHCQAFPPIPGLHILLTIIGTYVSNVHDCSIKILAFLILRCYICSVTKLDELKRHLKPGEVYRRERPPAEDGASDDNAGGRFLMDHKPGADGEDGRLQKEPQDL